LQTKAKKPFSKAFINTRPIKPGFIFTNRLYFFVVLSSILKAQFLFSGNEGAD
jgi:hypothetical protein